MIAQQRVIGAVSPESSKAWLTLNQLANSAMKKNKNNAKINNPVERKERSLKTSDASTLKAIAASAWHHAVRRAATMKHSMLSRRGKHFVAWKIGYYTPRNWFGKLIKKWATIASIYGSNYHGIECPLFASWLSDPEWMAELRSLNSAQGYQRSSVVKKF